MTVSERNISTFNIQPHLLSLMQSTIADMRSWTNWSTYMPTNFLQPSILGPLFLPFF